jgi:Spx/MgsR family transcriptional regulator
VPVTIFGIPNCDTIGKARAWLAAHGVAHAFHNYKAEGIDRKRLEAWCKALGWEAVLNRNGTTFRSLPESDKAGLDRRKAIALMEAHPSLIKRPILDIDGALLAGFDEERYWKAFGKAR